ncbi:MAG: protein kinase [Gemmatimonadaceae bacterium]|nr:protein kinase [Gemmatimonadaceae bacterium]
MSGPLPREAVGELRHELRTPVNLIVGYAEMLLEDAAPDAPEAGPLTEVIAAGRDVLERINAALPPSGVATEDGLATLLAEMRTPQQRIIGHARALVSMRSADAQFVADVEKIAAAATRLTEPPRPIAPSTARTAAAAMTSTGATATVGPAVPVSGRILVVDDVEDNRAVLSRRLSREGYEVMTAADGERALALLDGEAVDLVLLDVLMPGMDGYEVLARLKGSPKTRGVPVIMISALDDMASVVRCIEHGAEDYLPKPFDPVLLRARIGASLEKKRLHDREGDYLRQVGVVIDAAATVEQGTYAHAMLAPLVSRDDELGRLARVFDAMAIGVRAREERLQEQLRGLRADVVSATSEFEAAKAAMVADADDVLGTGTVLGARYEILGRIGRGGMGVVYRAHDRELGDDVAVKTIRQELLTSDPEIAERFRSEIRLARRISHRNVVRTHDLGEADGVSFVTMEYIRGLTLRELLSTRGRLSASSTLAIARQLTEALAVAHEAGVIHRDIKPENALIDNEGVVKVMDFGIARLAASTTRTMAGMIVGTPTYMSPEQLLGEDLDARADLYSAGVLLYECLAGHPPFTAPSAVALIGKVLTTVPAPLTEATRDVPPALAALIARLMAKERTERPADALELRRVLAEFE